MGAWFIGKCHLLQKGASSSAPSCWQFIYQLYARMYSHLCLYIYIRYMYIYTFKKILYKRCKEFSVLTSIEQKQNRKNMDSDLEVKHLFCWRCINVGHTMKSYEICCWIITVLPMFSPQDGLGLGLWNLLPACFNIFVESLSSVWPSFVFFFSAERKGYSALVRYFCFRDYPKLMILVEKGWSICPRCSLHGFYSIFIPLPILK